MRDRLEHRRQQELVAAWVGDYRLARRMAPRVRVEKVCEKAVERLFRAARYHLEKWYVCRPKAHPVAVKDVARPMRLHPVCRKKKVCGRK